MHITDFSTGQLGANAIVGGSVPIATGAAMALRYLRQGEVVCCFAGDGAYANGVVLESLNWANQAQFTNFLAGDRPFGLPVIYLVQNNHYGMTHRTDDEVMGVPWLAQRAAGFSRGGMHAEVVNGMDVLAVRDAVTRATEICRAGEGPVLIEASTYRYYGHSLSDPRNEYRTKDEEESWRAVDPIAQLGHSLVDAGVLDEAGLAAVHHAAAERNARAAQRAAAGTDPAPEDVLTYLYAGTSTHDVPAAFATPTLHEPVHPAKLTADGMLYRDALRDALTEEMTRDARVIFYGEDVADYGGAFKLTKGLLEAFGRDRVFNTPISEAAICGTAVGAAMAGLRPVVELMYMDFALMASDQIANQAGKWHYMSGAQTTVPLVIRASVGAGKGYGGQHSQSLESVFTHLPGLVIVYPATAADAKGLLKSAIRSDDPVLFVESQGLYATRGHVPEDPDLLVPLGEARVAREGSDATIVAWGPAVPDALTAAADARRGRHRVRRHRPADAGAAGHGDRAGVRAQDRALRGRGAGRAGRQLRERDRGARRGRGVRRPRCAGGAGGRQERHLAPGAESGAGVPAHGRGHRGGRARAHLMATPILMPRPGQMTEECTLQSWLKHEGDAVHKGDVLFEIETDKSNMEIETFEEGVLLRILVPEGATVPVNTLLAWIGQAGEAIPDSHEEPAAPTSQPAPTAQAGPDSRAGRPRPHHIGTRRVPARGSSATGHQPPGQPPRRGAGGRSAVGDRHRTRRPHRGARHPGRRRAPAPAPVAGTRSRVGTHRPVGHPGPVGPRRARPGAAEPPPPGDRRNASPSR